MTVAWQNERSTFVMLILYVIVVGGFIGDILIFKVSFGALEIVGASIVTVCTCAAIVNSLYVQK